MNLERCQIRSPVNGWVTNLLARIGDYATIGQEKIVLLELRFILDRCLFRRDQAW